MSEVTGAGASGPDVAAVPDLEARLAAAEDQRLRALADLDNLRKRCAAQVERAGADARAQVAGQWLAVRQQALSVLADLGFPRRDDTGATFDPARHEAIATTHDPRVPPGTVVQV